MQDFFKYPRIRTGRKVLYEGIHTKIAGELIFDLDSQKFFVVTDESGHLLEVTVADEVLPTLFNPRDIKSLSFEIVENDEGEDLVLAPLDEIL